MTVGSHPDEVQLLSDPLPPEVEAHLAACDACRARRAAPRPRFGPGEHPGEQALLAVPRDPEVAAHVQQCVECRAEERMLRIYAEAAVGSSFGGLGSIARELQEDLAAAPTVMTSG